MISDKFYCREIAIPVLRLLAGAHTRKNYRTQQDLSETQVNLFRPTLSDNLDLVLEGGLRYVIVESNAEAAIAVTDTSGGAASATSDIEIDNGVVALIAVNLEAELSPGFSFIGGLGYQVDLAKGDAEWMGEDLGENELKAFFIRAGVAIAF